MKEFNDWPGFRGPFFTFMARVQKGKVVLFETGYTDRYYLPFPYGDKCVADPLNGKSEGWPAPSPEAMIYLAAMITLQRKA